MARRTAVKRTKDVVVVNAAAPIRRRRTSGIRRRRPKRRRSSSVGQAGTRNVMVGTAMGGFAYGFLEKQFGAQIPALPIVGKSGAVAIACYFLSPRMKILRDVGIAAAAIAGYSFGKTGTVSGDDDVVSYDDLAQ